MMDRLQNAFEIQRDFIRDASHELRTPITIIRGHLELMDVLSAEQQESVDLSIEELDRVSRFIGLLADRKVFLSPTLNVFERRPGDKFESEEYHVEGFAKECAVVTHHRLEPAPDGGLHPAPHAKLSEPLIVRPTAANPTIGLSRLCARVSPTASWH